MRSHPKKGQVVKPDAAPRVDSSYVAPDSNVTPQRCLPLNPLVLREQAQGWCWDVMVLSISTGNTDGPTSLLSFLCSLVEMSKDTFSNNLKKRLKKKLFYFFIYYIPIPLCISHLLILFLVFISPCF